MKLNFNNKDGRMSSNKGYSFDSHYYMAKIILNEKDNLSKKNIGKKFFKLITDKFNLDNSDLKKAKDNESNYTGETFGWLAFSGAIKYEKDKNSETIVVPNYELLTLISNSFEDSLAFNYIRTIELLKFLSPNSFEEFMLPCLNGDSKIEEKLSKDNCFLFAEEFWTNYRKWWKGKAKVNFYRENSNGKLKKGDLEYDGKIVMQDARSSFVRIINYVLAIEFSSLLTRDFNFKKISFEDTYSRLETLTGNADNKKGESIKNNKYLHEIEFNRIKMIVEHLNEEYNFSNINFNEDEYTDITIKHRENNNFENWINNQKITKRNQFKKNLLKYYLEKNITEEIILNKYSIEICDGAHILSVDKITKEIKSIFLKYKNEDELKSIDEAMIRDIYLKNKRKIDLLLFMIADPNNGLFLDKTTHFVLDKKKEFVKIDVNTFEINVLTNEIKGLEEINNKKIYLFEKNEKSFNYLKAEIENNLSFMFNEFE